ncbi:MAG: hypothetical protein ABMA00_22735 [Gemmatimonas sp.]
MCCKRILRHLGDAEIRYLQLAARLHEEIGGLDVAMYQSRVMGSSEALQYLLGE